MRESIREARFGVGVPTLVMILTVLCLTTLGVLTLTAGRMDARLTKRSTEMTVGYYQAAAVAQERLAEMDRLLSLNDDGKAFRAWAVAEAMTQTPGGVAFSVDAGGERQLWVRVALTPGNEVPFRVVEHVLESRLLQPQATPLNLYR